MDAIKISDHNNQRVSESDIIKRILSGEKELYEILLRRNNQKLYRVIRSYIKDEAEIEDVMQNTYLKAYEKLHQFKQSSLYSTWLVRIGINEVLARLREKGKVVDINTGISNYKSNTVLEIPDKNQLNPEKRIIRKEMQRLIEDTIDSIDAKYRTVYILKEVEGMSVKEIAECLDISSSNVKVRIHRAKAMLKAKLYETAKGSNDLFEFGNTKCDRITFNVMQII
ncbi:RNA polymerase sigma factor [Maribacter sp. HTCC2170]|uniref:RNA polymerase sigma factor n=1 Tax=Maribacter sp. (strain HTCC2170 / KCCM 42371) TaxID=313603 RepID=UPI00006AFD7A|nr:RNA polymerase sigma factor [Maribacter sp. HTCC2170]EAR01149.1 RNA polymerase sigma-70 factor [Maribacter sp. HTCC2170]